MVWAWGGMGTGVTHITLKQDGGNSADNTFLGRRHTNFERNFVENITRVVIDCRSALLKIMACRLLGDKPFSKPIADTPFGGNQLIISIVTCGDVDGNIINRADMMWYFSWWLFTAMWMYSIKRYWSSTLWRWTKKINNLHTMQWGTYSKKNPPEMACGEPVQGGHVSSAGAEVERTPQHPQQEASHIPHHLSSSSSSPAPVLMTSASWLQMPWCHSNKHHGICRHNANKDRINNPT